MAIMFIVFGNTSTNTAPVAGELDFNANDPGSNLALLAQSLVRGSEVTLKAVGPLKLPSVICLLITTPLGRTNLVCNMLDLNVQIHSFITTIPFEHISITRLRVLVLEWA